MFTDADFWRNAIAWGILVILILVIFYSMIRSLMK
jgi:hypothetical protein